MTAKTLEVTQQPLYITTILPLPVLIPLEETHCYETEWKQVYYIILMCNSLEASNIDLTHTYNKLYAYITENDTDCNIQESG